MNVDVLLACNDERGEPDATLAAIQVWHEGARNTGHRRYCAACGAPISAERTTCSRACAQVLRRLEKQSCCR